MSKALEKRIAALESRLGGTARAPEGEPTLAAEIGALERRLTAMHMYMDDDAVEDEPGCGEVGMDDELAVIDEDVGMDDELAVIDEDVVIEPPEAEEMVELTMDDVAGDEMGCAQASLTKPGIEDQITQDYLDDVAELRPGAEELSTAPSMLSVAPTEYTARLRKASTRLDTVAEYLEKNGRTELAFRIDKISDAIEARIKGGQQ